MIKGIILDVDGVIVGEKIGYNSPYPHKDIIQTLKKLRKKGIYIIFCTAKPHYSIQKIINDAQLNNLHITNGGGVVIDPINNIILKKHIINTKDAQEVVKKYLDNNVYTEFYSVNEYFIQKSQLSKLTDIHTHVLQKKPHIVQSIGLEVRKQEIVKIMPIAKDEKDKQRLIEIFNSFKDKLTLSWGIHPIALPHLFGIITAKGISKKQAVIDIAENIHISPDEMLGVGDSTSDWQFIETCKYGGAMGNGSKEIKNLVLSKGVKYGFVGDHVNKNGLLSIFKHFELT